MKKTPEMDILLNSSFNKEKFVTPTTEERLCSALVDIHNAAGKCLYEIGEYPCRRDSMTEREGRLATMVESLVATMQYVKARATTGNVVEVLT